MKKYGFKKRKGSRKTYNRTRKGKGGKGGKRLRTYKMSRGGIKL